MERPSETHSSTTSSTYSPTSTSRSGLTRNAPPRWSRRRNTSVRARRKGDSPTKARITDVPTGERDPAGPTSSVASVGRNTFIRRAPSSASQDLPASPSDGCCVEKCGVGRRPGPDAAASTSPSPGWAHVHAPADEKIGAGSSRPRDSGGHGPGLTCERRAPTRARWIPNEPYTRRLGQAAGARGPGRGLEGRADTVAEHAGAFGAPTRSVY